MRCLSGVRRISPFRLFGLQVSILRSQRDVYAAEIEGRDGRRLLMKIGPGDFCPSGSGWAIADCGHNWSVWERC
jgi:alpha-amylase